MRSSGRNGRRTCASGCISSSWRAARCFRPPHCPTSSRPKACSAPTWPRRVRRQLVREIEAQFDIFSATGLPLDHVNTHKHYHLHPTIASLILQIGRCYGMRASRAPVEPRAVLAAVDPAAAPPPAWVTEPWARLVRARYRIGGVTMADQVFGLAWSGAMTPARTAGIIRRLPDRLSELYLHPATGGGFEGAAPGYRYAEELAALLSPETAEAVAASGAVLGAFSDFVGPLSA
jgi:hopanoid biosynthesis associated protein HpnK